MGMIEDFDVRSQAYYQTGSVLAGMIDDVLRRAISKRLGREDWDDSELHERLRVVLAVSRDEPRQYYLDEKLLAVIWPEQITSDETGISITQKFAVP